MKLNNGAKSQMDGGTGRIDVSVRLPGFWEGLAFPKAQGRISDLIVMRSTPGPKINAAMVTTTLRRRIKHMEAMERLWARAGKSWAGWRKTYRLLWGVLCSLQRGIRPGP